MPRTATKPRRAAKGQMTMEMPAPAVRAAQVPCAAVAAVEPEPVRRTLAPRYGAESAALPPPSVDQVVLTARRLVNAQEPAQPFGAWLLRQKGRAGLIGALATAAAADRAFPKAGTVEDVRGRLEAGGADGDMFEALDDAESAWLAL